MKRLLILLAALAALLLCGCDVDKPEAQAAGQISLAEAAALQPGEAAQVEVTAELREYYFKLARLEDWYHIPEFTTPEDLPTDPLAYWFMLLAEGRTGWDKYGNLTGPSPWLHRGYLYLPDYNYYFDIYGIDEAGKMNLAEDGLYTAVSKEQLEAWVQQHFGPVPLQHAMYNPNEAWRNKNYYFDGQNYYFTCVEGAFAPLSGWQLDALQAANAGGRIVYTAEVRLYCLYEYGFAAYDEDVSFEENMSQYAQSVYGRTENKPVYEAYGRQMIQNEITLDEAARQMVIAGDTEGFPWRERLRVRFYINEQTGEPFYLQVESLPLED